MAKLDKTYVKWIKSNKEDYLDPKTGEYNTTGIAEGLADRFDLYEGNDDMIPDFVFDMAVKVVHPD